ncbi:MAG: GNAT family N-acetyltransferase [Bacteroidales bacterium]|nr:GNAT family N-acetyltransferase [Bacteroidales bacterium]
MIRRATYDDVPVLMDVFRKARGIMRSSGNMNQWNDGYPSEAVVRKDIDNGHCVVLCEEGEVVATMAFIPGPDPTYAEIYDGGWLSDEPYHVIHRIAVAEPGHNAAKALLDWGFGQAGSIRIDTHKDNVIMHHVLSKYGFTHCGMILLANGDPREAYQKDL